MSYKKFLTKEQQKKALKIRAKANNKQGLVGWLFFRNEEEEYPIKMIPFYGSRENYRKATKKLRKNGSG